MSVQPQPTHKPSQAQSQVKSQAQSNIQHAKDSARRASESASEGVKRVKRYSSMSTNKFIGLSIWIAGAWMTTNTLSQLGISQPLNIIIGILLQLALTRAESPIWSGNGVPKMGIGALIIDVAVNSGGVWPYVKNIGNTDLWNMIKDVAEDPSMIAGVGVQLFVAIFIGTLAAAAAEYFWNEG